MISENNKTSDLHRLKIDLTHKMYLRRGDKGFALSELNIYYTWKNIKALQKNKSLKTTGKTRDEKFEISEGSYSISNIKDKFEYINKGSMKHGKNKPSV